MRQFFYVCIALSAMIIFVGGCTKNIKEASESPGLDTIPFYPKNSSAFDTKAALKALEEEKKAEEQRKAGFVEEIKQRVEQSAPDLRIDPWIPPAVRKPEELPKALRGFPKDAYGYPDWVAAVREGIIKPRGSLAEGVEEAQGGAVFDEDILFEINDRLMANVLFPHSIHNYWLSCKNCHPSIFIDKKGANKFTMYDIWNGKYCGRCHGKVAFQPKGFENCQRCHKVKKKTMGIK
ncbi:MAG: hypothetical protein HY266_10215 [Deltaproteobacteria bacterium]|nr:hypothetical protein [Deltaproteobacteria bacterium]